jgi:hypothetical protein
MFCMHDVTANGARRQWIGAVFRSTSQAERAEDRNDVRFLRRSAIVTGEGLDRVADMNTTFGRALMIAAVLTGALGCQSGPRWAWWKPEKAPEDTSLIARSAEAPALPSAQSTPQVVGVAGLEPAAPPSSANLAAAGTQTTPDIAPTSPATIANAPLANYPSIDSTPNKMAAMPGSAPASNGTATSPAAIAIPRVSAGAMSPQVANATVPASGPYDPNAYQPTAAFSAAASASAAGAAPPSADRYQFAADRYNVPSTNSSGIATNTTNSLSQSAPASPAISQAGGDRYGLAVPDRSIANPQVDFAASQSPIGGPSAATMTTAPVPPAASAVNPPAVSASSTATVQFATPPGQYRPGGTSSYAGSKPTQHIEVATRPAPPTSAAPVQESSSAVNSVPWTPPTSPAAGTGTRTY